MYLLFDIGGTKMRLAISQDGEHFDAPVKVATPTDDFAEGVRLFVETTRELSGGEPIAAVAGGIAGVFDAAAGALVSAPHLSGWIHKPLREELARAIGCDVFIANDAAVVGLGEAVSGAGLGHEIVAYLTVSTGVGGARIVRGTIDAHRAGFEIGHHIINMNEPDVFCATCPEQGHVEGYISGTAFEKRYGKKAYEVDDPAAWDSAARTLAVALNNVTVFWSPDILVLGGAMIVGDPAIPLELVERYFEMVLKIFPERPRIARAALGDVGGLYGALALLKNKPLKAKGKK